MKLKPILIVLEILLTFLLTIVVDRGVGLYFKKSGYFKAMVPNLTQNYKSNEYGFVARTSDQGIRNDHVFDKKKGTLRILALGDSFTWGWGVSDNQSWPKILEQQLLAYGKTVEVINAGIPGGDLKTEVDVCLQYADLFDIDMIILGFYGSDDLLQNLAQVESFDQNKQNQKFIDKITAYFWPNFVRLGQKKYVVGPVPGEEKGASVDISEIWKIMAKRYLEQNLTLPNTVSEKIRTDFEKGTISPHLVLQAVIDQNYLVHVLEPKLLDSSLVATDRLLTDLQSCAQGRMVLVVFMPSEEMISEVYQSIRGELGYRVDPKLLDIDMDSLLSPVVDKHGFSYLSLLSDFRSNGCTDCYFPYDTHLTVVGHERVAEYISLKLKMQSSK